MNIDYKHILAAVIGGVLGIAGSYFGIDFSKSCPASAPAIVSVVPAK